MISDLKSQSGKDYATGKLVTGEHQYVDRLYQFDYVPDALKGCLHIKTHGDDKLISEEEICFSFQSDEDIEVYILYPDIQPVIPKWLESFERTRLNVTRFDSVPSNLKGYFSLYKKAFSRGEVVLFGNSPKCMLEQDWYIDIFASGYCMYSVCVKQLSRSK